MIYFLLFREFALIGLFAIGGGLATLPFLYDLADRTAWISHAQIADMIAVAESTPGAIGINMATYTGVLVAGPAGGMVATLGLILPSIIIISAISHGLSRFQTNYWVTRGLAGIRPAALGLIAAAGLGILSLSLLNPEGQGWYQRLDWKPAFLFIAILGVMIKFKQHPIWYIVAGAALGIALGL